MLIEILFWTIAFLGGASLSAIATLAFGLKAFRNEGYEGITAALALALVGITIWTAGFIAFWLL